MTRACRHLIAILFLLLAAVLPVPAAQAVEPVDIAIDLPNIDISSFLAGLETGEKSVTIERPDQQAGLKEFLTLNANGSGPRYFWVAVGFKNSAKEPRTVTLAIPDSGFVGSGMVWPKPPGSNVAAVTTVGAIKLETENAPDGHAFTFTLAPGETGAVAFETLRPGLEIIKLWRQDAYAGQKDYFAFFRGAILGITVLLTLALLALYGFRAKAIFLAAGGLALACVGFIALESGHAAGLLAELGELPFDLAEVRTLIEGLMAAFLLLFLGTHAELRRLSPLAANMVLVIGGLSLGIPVYGFVEPAIAAAAARGLFAATAMLGFLLYFFLWRRGELNVEPALITWATILLWAFFATVAMLDNARTSTLEPLLLAGLGAVLVVMTFTLAHYAFSQGYLSRTFFREAGRRALALAGARAFVWDWQSEGGDLFVGDELESALSLLPGSLVHGGYEAFMDIMHPSDRNAYLSAVEAAESQGRGVIEREFRLHHADGTWRWFMLRARAMAGPGSRAVRCIGTLTDVTDVKRTEDRLLNDAVYDAVTGLPNRALFMDRLNRALQAESPVARGDIHVAIIDIDRFKMMNDALGHEAGDSLLSVIGRRLSSTIGPTDTVARLPGDQFAILFAGSASRDPVEFTENLRRAVARPIMLDDQEIFMTGSIGVARHQEDATSAEQMMKDAAIALYEAKRQGADSIMVFRSSMRDDRAELVVLESELRRAIERNEIEVHYQPIARLADMNLAGFEALVRWRHPVLGLLSPESFIGLAEQTGMIHDIGRAVINEAARQLGIWQRSFRPAEPVFVAVNVSSAQLIDTSIIDDIKLVLHREGVHRQSLKIEITESLVMQFPERAAQILARFKEMGVGLACDDFGTGYSSLSTLRKLPFDTLKVDRSFIEVDAGDERATIILQAILAMAHALGLTVVAEGIENQEQVDRLGELNCDLGQGFFIGPPMTARQVNEALAGLPYATSTGRTAITWLWERAARDPTPQPNTIDVTAAGIAQAHAQQEAAEAARREPPILAELRDHARPQANGQPAPAEQPKRFVAPMAPRTTKKAKTEAKSEEPIVAINRPKPKRRRRKKRESETPAQA